eukprot:365743-Chlamydomonas_euryale.AAC.26
MTCVSNADGDAMPCVRDVRCAVIRVERMSVVRPLLGTPYSVGPTPRKARAGREGPESAPRSAAPRRNGRHSTAPRCAACARTMFASV